jgi:hypothetical protein
MVEGKLMTKTWQDSFHTIPMCSNILNLVETGIYMIGMSTLHLATECIYNMSKFIQPHRIDKLFLKGGAFTSL